MQTESITPSYEEVLSENKVLKKKLENHKPVFSFTYIEGNDKATQFYTGLPTWAVFLHLYMYVLVSFHVQLKTLPYMYISTLRRRATTCSHEVVVKSYA